MLAQFVERLGGQRRATARSVEIFLDPWMVEFHEVRHGIDRDHLAIRQHRHPVADLVQRVEIVGDEEDGEAERLFQLQRQPVEGRRADRIETRRRLVEEQQFGIERQCAGEAGTLLHPAGKFGRVFVYRFLRQARQLDLVARDVLAQLVGQVGEELLERHLDILAHGQGGEQRPALKKHAPAIANAQHVVRLGIGDRATEHLDMPLGGDLQADDRAHQNRFAGARSADHAEDFAALDLQVEAVVNGLVAEAVDQVLHHQRIIAAIALVAADLAFVFVERHQAHPSSVKNTAKKASSTITAKMPVTTAMVVLSPTSSEFPLTCMP